MLKVAFISDQNAKNINSWSGILYHISDALEKQGIFLRYIISMQYLWAETKKSIEANPQKPHDSWWHYINPVTLKNSAIALAKDLKNYPVDLILCHGALPVAYLETDIPVICWDDATSVRLINHYPKYKDLDEEIINLWFMAEKSAFNKAALLIYPSEWAAESAVKDYQIVEEKVKVIPFGANLESGLNEEQLINIVKSRSASLYKLLFIGKDWIRKGGEQTVKVAEYLNKKGLKTELTVIGTDLKEYLHPIPDFIKESGFVDKSSESGINLMRKTLSESHFLIMPSQAECYGIGLCEANSFGVPCLTTDVGGIPTVIKDDINGKKFSLDTTPDVYADYIHQAILNDKLYYNLALSSFREYKSRLNWNIAAKTIKDHIQFLLKTPQHF